MSLTPKQEEYCHQRFLGKSQYESYLTAFPSSQKWKRNAVDVKASQLESLDKIKVRIAELNKPAIDFLTSKKTLILETAIKLIDGTATPSDLKKINPQVLNKLLDKIEPTKTENKTDLSLGESIIDLIKARKRK